MERSGFTTSAALAFRGLYHAVWREAVAEMAAGERERHHQGRTLHDPLDMRASVVYQFS
jgi:hypothetical protein